MKTTALIFATFALLCLCPLCWAEPDTRCYELRVYHPAPDKMGALFDRFRDHSCALLEKHGFTNVGYWIFRENEREVMAAMASSELPKPNQEWPAPKDRLVYILSSPSRAAHEAAWKAFFEDPEWKRVVRETEANGPLVTKVDSVFLKATDFSPVPAPSGGGEGRCFELRTYTATPGKMDALLARFRDRTLGLFSKHGMTHIGYWTTADDGEKQLIYILAHKDRMAAGESFRSFRADPDWIEARKASEADGSLTEKVESVFMLPVAFSAIK